MITIVKSAFLIILFICLYICFRYAIESLLALSAKRARLSYIHTSKSKVSRPSGRMLLLAKHIEVVLTSIQLHMRPSNFILISILAALSGIISGYYLFGTIRGLLLLSVFLGVSPYLMLRLRLLNIQMKTRLEFLPAVEIFYQHYVLSYHKNVRNVLSTIIKEERMTYPIRPVFEQLHRQLMTNERVEDSLQVFRLTLGHIWGDYFANMLKLSLVEGVDISSSLNELVADMRRAKQSDQLAKHRLLEIRFANFSPLLFLGVFLFINFKMNPTQAHLYYFVYPEGRQMLMDAVFMIFASFVMGVMLSIRKM